VLSARGCERQVSKTAEHARAVPAINVTKWRTTNKVFARGELFVKNMGSVKRTTLLVCLGVSSEKSVVIIHIIIPFILLLLVKMFATTRKRSGLSFSCWFNKVSSRWISLRFGLRSRRFFHEEISKMTFFRSNGLEKMLYEDLLSLSSKGRHPL